MSNYERTATIYGLIDVQEDINLLPGDQLKIINFSTPENPCYGMVVIKGDPAWDTCRELIEQPGDDPIIDDLPKINSRSLSNGSGKRHEKIEEFMGDRPEQFRRLTGEVTIGADKADVTIWAVTSPKNKTEAFVMKVVHRTGGAQQNGTAHGDWT